MMFFAPMLLVLLGLATKMAVGLAYGVRGPDHGDSFHLLLRIVSWALVGLGCTAWLLMSFGALPIAILLAILVGFTLVDSVRGSRAMHRRNNSKLLAIAAHDGHLSNAAELLAEARGGWFVAEPAAHLASDLRRGTPLYESVVASPAALPRLATAYAAIGTLSGAEAHALDELAKPDNPQLASAWRTWLDQMAYAIAVLLTMAFLLACFCGFILPQFWDIFWEFGLELPAMTQLVMSLADVTIAWVLLALGCAVLLVVLFVVGVYYLLDSPILQRFTDMFCRRVHTSSALRLLALSVEHRAELPRAVYALSVTHPARGVRRRLSDAYQDIAAGQPWAEVLMHHRLLSPQEKPLAETAEAVGNLPWALRQIAMRRESMFVAKLITWGHVAFPILVLAVGGFVGFLVISVFAPLVWLISGLA